MIVAIGWGVFKMDLKFGSDGWSQWVSILGDGNGRKYRGYLVQISFEYDVDWVSEGRLVSPRVWELLLIGNPKFRCFGDPKEFRVKKPKGLAMLEESMYELNITGNTEQKLLENTQ